MENRFGVKDLFLVLLLVALIVLVALGMKQYDRQWSVLRDIRQQGEDQTRELSELRRVISRGVQFGPASTATTQSTDKNNDPFVRIEDAQKLPGYALGDWYVMAIPNTDKITPLVSGDIYADEVQSRVLESLATRDPVTLEWQPLLAQSWKTSDDGLMMTFQLRRGITFSDGEPFTSADVVFTYNWIMNPKVEAPRERAFYDKIASVTADGDNRVTFKFKEPYFDAFALAGGMNILPRHFYGKYSPDDFNKSTGLLLGTGPYQMQNATDWSPGKPLELVRNERYWGPQPPFDKLVYKIIDNDLARLTAFRNGEIDVFGAQPEQYQKLLQDPDVLKRAKHLEYNDVRGGYMYIAWNEKKNGKPTVFADRRVRQAMTMLINREQIVKEILLGYATVSTGPFSRGSKQYNPEVKPWPYDVQGAKSLLAEAGFHDNGQNVLIGPDGQPFSFKFTFVSGSQVYTRIALYLKDAFAAAGISMQADAMDWSVFSDHLKNHDYDAISLGWSSGIEDDIYQMFDSSQVADGGDNFISYSNPELDKLIEQARTTVDEKKRMPLWRACHTILHEDQPYTFLFSRQTLRFEDNRIKNIQKLPLGLNDLTEWFVPKDQRKWEH